MNEKLIARHLTAAIAAVAKAENALGVARGQLASVKSALAATSSKPSAAAKPKPSKTSKSDSAKSSKSSIKVKAAAPKKAPLKQVATKAGAVGAAPKKAKAKAKAKSAD